jgi:hypothetical protein
VFFAQVHKINIYWAAVVSAQTQKQWFVTMVTDAVIVTYRDFVVNPVPYLGQVSPDYSARGQRRAVINVVITKKPGKSFCVACKTLKHGTKTSR